MSQQGEKTEQKLRNDHTPVIMTIRQSDATNLKEREPYGSEICDSLEYTRQEIKPAVFYGSKFVLYFR